MTVPLLIQQYAADIYPNAGSAYSSEHECEGSKFHSPNPLLVHEVDLVPWDSHPTSHTAWLCGTCRGNLWVYQKILYERKGDIPWDVQRSFGNGIRALAKRGWGFYVTYLAGLR
jgi:hypothetical protein